MFGRSNRKKNTRLATHLRKRCLRFQMLAWIDGGFLFRIIISRYQGRPQHGTHFSLSTGVDNGAGVISVSTATAGVSRIRNCRKNHPKDIDLSAEGGHYVYHHIFVPDGGIRNGMQIAQDRREILSSTAVGNIVGG